MHSLWIAGLVALNAVGVVVLSGLLFATLVTLTFLPALLVTVLRFMPTRRKFQAAKPA